MYSTDIYVDTYYNTYNLTYTGDILIEGLEVDLDTLIVYVIGEESNGFVKPIDRRIRSPTN